MVTAASRSLRANGQNHIGDAPGHNAGAANGIDAATTDKFLFAAR